MCDSSADKVIDLADIPQGRTRGAERAIGKYDLGTFTRDLFFLWAGVAFLANVGLGAGLLGLGVITLGAQAVRKYLELPVKWFWLAVGVLFFAWGWVEWLGIGLRSAPIPGGAAPIAVLVVGIALVTYALLRRR